MKIFTIRKGLVAALSFGALILGIGVYAAVNNTIADGVYAHFEQFGGPAATRMRTLTIAPGEVLGWHNHPGVGAYTIVKQGTLTVEDGCGFETVYTQGQAFIEPAGRVHRGKNLTSEPVITAQTFIVPLGNPYTIDTGQVCGRPIKIEECTGNGWETFNYPRNFYSQDDCISSVNNGEGSVFMYFRRF
ncbi:MAG: cupin domain-containing protein [Acidobacteria bacterium]|nr:cupin domain-containing protein [Acidobacteriota bacterium]MCA1637721.1 cupin domain-containing protein [Acidobacteriota bacterium]